MGTIYSYVGTFQYRDLDRYRTARSSAHVLAHLIDLDRVTESWNEGNKCRLNFRSTLAEDIREEHRKGLNAQLEVLADCKSNPAIYACGLCRVCYQCDRCLRDEESHGITVHQQDPTGQVCIECLLDEVHSTLFPVQVQDSDPVQVQDSPGQDPYHYGVNGPVSKDYAHGLYLDPSTAYTRLHGKH